MRVTVRRGLDPSITVRYAAFRATDASVREALMAGRRHVYEAEMKEARRTRGVPGHESRPDDLPGGPAR